MKILVLLSIWLAPMLVAQEFKTSGKAEPVVCERVAGGCPDKTAQTPLTPDEHDAYVLMVLQDLIYQNALLENLRTHKAGNDDLENRDKAHAERMNALKDLIAKHNACENGDWSIAKKEWACPVAKVPKQ